MHDSHIMGVEVWVFYKIAMQSTRWQYR